MLDIGLPLCVRGGEEDARLRRDESLEEVEEAERAAAGEYSAPRGDLAITSPIVFGRLHVLPVVTDFLKAYPEIGIRLTQTDRLVNLVEDHVDLAVRIGELPDSGPPRGVRLVVNTAEAAIDAAIAGVGITRVLSYQIASAVQAGMFAVALQEFEPTPWPVSLVHTGQPLLPLKLRAFLDFAGPRLKGRLQSV